jgi:hypothetical protein
LIGPKDKSLVPANKECERYIKQARGEYCYQAIQSLPFETKAQNKNATRPSEDYGLNT